MSRNAAVAIVAALVAVAVVGAIAANLSDASKTVVTAPGTEVQTNGEGTHVKAPFVDVRVPKKQ